MSILFDYLSLPIIYGYSVINDIYGYRVINDQVKDHEAVPEMNSWHWTVRM